MTSRFSQPHPRPKALLLLGLPLLLAIPPGRAVGDRNLRPPAASAAVAPPPPSALRDFLAWPLRALSRDGDGDSEYDDGAPRPSARPPWSARPPDGRGAAGGFGGRVLFSFELSGGAAERYRRLGGRRGRRRRTSTAERGARAEEEEEEEGRGEGQVAAKTLSDGHGDGHGDVHGRGAHGDDHDAHSDAHEMVVHVTYEDICEFQECSSIYAHVIHCRSRNIISDPFKKRLLAPSSAVVTHLHPARSTRAQTRSCCS